MKEIWKPVVYFEKTHCVSNLGKIKSLPRKYVKEERMLKQTNIKGYMTISLNKDGIQYGKLVHRIVAEAFIKNSNHKKEVNHLDLNKKNNKVSNLEWCTRLENMSHASNLGVIPKMCGEKNGMSTLKKEDIYFIRKSKLKLKKLSIIFNTSMSNISEIRRKKTWKHI